MKAKKSSAVILGLAESQNREFQKENDCHSEASLFCHSCESENLKSR